MKTTHLRLLMEMDEKHFKASVLPHRARLFRMAFFMLKSTEAAEDLLQDIMVKLWSKRVELAEKKNIEAFCVTVTKNACLDWLKAKKNQPHEDVHELQFYSDGLSPEHALEQKESRNVMLSAINRLSDKQRELILLREIEGYNYEEISQLTGAEINNIRVTLSRARKLLKAIMTKEEQQDA